MPQIRPFSIQRSSLIMRNETPELNTQSSNLFRTSQFSSDIQLKFTKMEKKWNRNFSVTASKNNDTLHTDYKEYFDRPLQYNVSGFGRSILPLPMMIYEKKDGSPLTSKIIVNSKKIKQLEKRAETERLKMSKVSLKKQLEMINPHKNTEYGFNNNQMFATFLRASKQVKSDKSIRKMESKWNNRFAKHISDHNEVSFKKYRFFFDDS